MVQSRGMLLRAAQLSVILQLVLTLVTTDFGHKLYFQPGRELHFARLSKMMQNARQARVFVAHDVGDKGFTSQGFRLVNARGPSSFLSLTVMIC
jgi:hypothetical protein